MDASLSDGERAELKAKAIASLRSIEADLDRSEQIHGYKTRGQVHLASPTYREWFNEALRDLRRAGEDISEWEIRSPHLIPWKASKRRSAPNIDGIDGSSLRADIKRMLERIDPEN